MARDAEVHDLDMPSLEYDDEETAYVGTETPSFDADDAALGSTFVIVDEDTVSDPDDDDDMVAPLVNCPVSAESVAVGTPAAAASPSSGVRPKFLDKIKEHKSYQRLAKMIKKKGPEFPFKSFLFSSSQFYPCFLRAFFNNHYINNNVLLLLFYYYFCINDKHELV